MGGIDMDKMNIRCQMMGKINGSVNIFQLGRVQRGAINNVLYMAIRGIVRDEHDWTKRIRSHFDGNTAEYFVNPPVFSRRTQNQ